MTGAEALSAFVTFVPTYFAPVKAVQAILPRSCVGLLNGRSLRSYLSQYAGLYFELQFNSGNKEWLVRLRDDVAHPLRGTANQKFTETGMATIPRDEYLVLDGSMGGELNVKPSTPPPTIAVNLRTSSPALTRLCALIPDQFETISTLEERIPQDLLYHAYFDTQGGIRTIAGKFPEYFQCVDDQVRLRPSGVAPLAIAEFSIQDSPLKEIAELIQSKVRQQTVPEWISLTSIYETLSAEQRSRMRQSGYRSFAGFVRAHGKAFCVSTDFLFVSRWDPPAEGQSLKTKISPRELLEAFHQRMKSGNYTQKELLSCLSPNELRSLPVDFSLLMEKDSRFEVSTCNGESIYRRLPNILTQNLLTLLKEQISEEGTSKVLLEETVRSDPRFHGIDLGEVLQTHSKEFELLDGDIFLVF